MKILKRPLAGLIFVIASATSINYAQASIVEPFTGGQLSASGWSAGIGADASLYLSTPSPDGSYGIALSEGDWSYNTGIHFLPGDRLSAWINPGPSPTADNNAQGGRIYVGFNAGVNGAYSFVAASDTNELGFQNNAGYTTPGFTASTPQSYLDQWYLLTIGLSANGGSATANIYDTDGVTLLSSVTKTGLSSANTGIALRGIGGAAITSLSITAVPLPAALWLFAPVSGFLLMLSRRRRGMV
jgi:hypothetical protein